MTDCEEYLELLREAWQQCRGRIGKEIVYVCNYGCDTGMTFHWWHPADIVSLAYEIEQGWRE